MGNRGQKCAEMVDELPTEKQACSSLDFRPSSSNSSVQTHINPPNSAHETRENDMETSSSALASSRSEGEPERDSVYGSCDSNDAEQRHSNLRHYCDYQRQRSSTDHGKFKRILSSLSEETGLSEQLASLTELCEGMQMGGRERRGLQHGGMQMGLRGLRRGSIDVERRRWEGEKGKGWAEEGE